MSFVDECCKNTGRTCQSTETCEKSESTTLNGCILFTEDSHVLAYPLPGKNVDYSTSKADCGGNLQESLASYDPGTSSWKTAQTLLSGGLAPFSQTWPRAGTMQNGRCYRRAPWVRHIHEKGCSLWPTPTATDTTGRGYHISSGKIRLALPGAIQVAEGNHYQNPGTRKTNPAFVEYLMGFPIGWTDLED